MLRPADFTKAHRTSNVTPYQMVSGPDHQPERSSSNGGVFHRGQIVWTQEPAPAVDALHSTVGFVDGLGHVVVDPRFLKYLDVSAAVQN